MNANMTIKFTGTNVAGSSVPSFTESVGRGRGRDGDGDGDGEMEGMIIICSLFTTRVNKQILKETLTLKQL